MIGSRIRSRKSSSCPLHLQVYILYIYEGIYTFWCKRERGGGGWPRIMKDYKRRLMMCWKYKINNTIVQNHHGNWRQSLETVVVSWFCCNKNTRTCKYCGNTRHLITSHVTMAICITFTVAMVNSCTFYSMSKSPRVKSNLIKEHPKIIDSWCNIVQECFESTWLLGKPLCILLLIRHF